jgi:hypothetical protein
VTAPAFGLIRDWLHLFRQMQPSFICANPPFVAFP